jgi:hypothetical protein
MSRITRTRIAVAATAALAISCGGPAASAYWQTLGSNDGGARADTILALGAPTATASAGGAAVNWAQGSTAGGRAVSGYTVARYSSAIPNAKVAAGGGCAGTISAPLTTLSCSEAALPAGTWYYTVTPVLGSWAGVESARSGGVVIADTTKPNAPIIGAAGIVNSGNKFNAPVSGTAAVGVSSVTVTATDAGGLQRFSQAVSPNAGQWAVSNFDLSGLSDGVITYTAVAKNAAGNSSDPSSAVTTTKDTVAPKAQALSLNNGVSPSKANRLDEGDQVVLTFDKALDPSTICGAWTAPSGTYSVDAPGAVSVTVTSTSLTVDVASACGGVARVGAVSLSRSYVTTPSATFRGTATVPSSMVWNPTTRTLTISLGALVSGATVNGAAPQGTDTAITFPSGLKDVAGNPLTELSFTGSKSFF